MIGVASAPTSASVTSKAPYPLAERQLIENTRQNRARAFAERPSHGYVCAVKTLPLATCTASYRNAWVPAGALSEV